MRFPRNHHFGWAGVYCACLCLAPAAGFAQILDRIEVSRVNGAAEIRIDFAVQIQYLRHSPPGRGRELNIFVKAINAAPPESEVTEETMTSPKTDLVPSFSVLYPHLGNAVSIRFDQGIGEWTVRPGPDNRSIVVTVPLLKGARDLVAEVRAEPQPPKSKSAPVPAPLPAPIAVAAPVAAPAAAVAEVLATDTGPAEPTTPTLTADQIEVMAKGFMEDARKALAEKDLARAINRLNRNLGLPTNSQTEAAQAMIGEVREQNGEIAKAKAEYELYLKLYPNGTDAKRIKDRLAALPTATPRAQSRSRPLVRGPAEWMVFGSLFQGYYTGKSHIEVTTPPPPGQLDFTTDTLSRTDQNSLNTNLDINARRRDGITDTRIVFRDYDTRNFLNTSRSYNRLYSAYVEQSDKELGYFVRAGRQSPTGSGVMERFDGLNVGYSFADRWRVNGVAGYAVEFMSPYQKTFYGTSVEMQPQPDSIGLLGYVIRQNLDGALNRQAVGLETRYFDMHASAFSMLDYDTLYKGVNIFMLQGNYRSDDGINYFTYLDRRKTPSYSLTNVLPALNGMTIKEAISAVGIEQMRSDARLLTATSNMASIGLTVPVSPQWQVGVDYRAASITETHEVEAYPTYDNTTPDKVAAMPASGISRIFGLQGIGTTLFGGSDVVVINTNYIKNPTFRGQSLGGNFVHQIGEAWRFDLNLRYYQQKDDDDQKQVRISPSIRVGYRWEKLASVEAEAGQEIVRIDGPELVERDKRTYFYLGYRLDMR